MPDNVCVRLHHKTLRYPLTRCSGWCDVVAYFGMLPRPPSGTLDTPCVMCLVRMCSSFSPPSLSLLVSCFCFLSLSLSLTHILAHSRLTFHSFIHSFFLAFFLAFFCCIFFLACLPSFSSFVIHRSPPVPPPPVPPSPAPTLSVGTPV